MPPSRSEEIIPPSSRVKRGQYTKQACQQCKRRRTKCNGASPSCSVCARHGDPCSYAEGGDKRTVRSREFVLALEDRNKLLEERVRHLEAWLDRDDQQESSFTLRPSRSSSTSGGDASASGPFTSSSKDNNVSQTLLFEPWLSYQSRSEAIAASVPTTDSAVATSHADLSSDGSIAWRNRLPHRTLNLTGWDDALHDRALACTSSYNSCFQIVDETAFRRDMARCLSVSPSTRTFAYSPFLHLALLALGCQWSNDLRTNDPAVAARLTARAQTALEEEAERPTLSTIQGLLILGHHHSSAGRSVLGNVFVNFGFQTCRRLGLGSDGGTMAPHASLLEDQRCARLRTYWACFILDKRFAASTGSQPILLSTPDEVPEWPPNETSLVYGGPALLQSAFHWLARLSVIESRILQTLRDVDMHSSDTIVSAAAFNLDLEDWLASLPAALRLSPQTRTPPPHSILRLNVLHQFLVIFLHRPWFLGGNLTDTSLSENAFRRCINAANRIVSLMRLSEGSSDPPFTTLFPLQAISAAATTALLTITHAQRHRQPQKAEEACDLFKACLSLLDPQRHPLPAVRVCHQVLSRIGAERGIAVVGENRPVSQRTTELASVDNLDASKPPFSDLLHSSFLASWQADIEGLLGINWSSLPIEPFDLELLTNF